jgi:hypothetical protein
VTDFADIERFARSHDRCGGITPNATTKVDGGYLLTLTCACGVSMDRWVTPEEARLPLAFSGPRSTAAPARPDETPRAPAPSTDLEEVMRQALEAEEAADARARAAASTPPAPPLARPPASAVAKPVTPPAVARTTPPPVPVAPVSSSPVAPPGPPPAAPSRERIHNLEEAVQRALEADAKTAAASSAGPRPRARPAPSRLNADAAVQRALDSQTTAGAAPPPARSRFWFGALVIALIIGGVVVWLGLRALEEDARQGTREGQSRMEPPVSSQVQRAAFSEALRALKDVQAASTPTVPYPTYSSRVAFAKSDVDRYVSGAAAANGGVRDAMELHMLATAAWKARMLDSKEAWEAVGQDPAIELCPSAKRMIDFTEAAGQSRAHARGLGVAAAIPLLWECAGARLNALDAVPSE